MQTKLKEILNGIVTDLREQGHDPLDRPVVFIWSYPEEEFKYTLVIQAREEEDHGYIEDDMDQGDEDTGEAVH